MKITIRQRENKSGFLRKIGILLPAISLFTISLAQAQDFKLGYFFTKSGNRITGYIDIQLSDNYIRYKPVKNGKKQKVSIDTLNSVVLYAGLSGRDSLLVLTENNNEKKKFFGQFELATPVTRFYYKFKEYTYGGNPTMNTMTTPTGANGAAVTTVRWTKSPTYYGMQETIFYQDGNTTYELTKSNYADVLSKAFADVPELVKRIQNNEFKFKKVHDIFEEYKAKTTFKWN